MRKEKQSLKEAKTVAASGNWKKRHLNEDSVTVLKKLPYLEERAGSQVSV